MYCSLCKHGCERFAWPFCQRVDDFSVTLICSLHSSVIVMFSTRSEIMIVAVVVYQQQQLSCLRQRVAATHRHYYQWQFSGVALVASPFTTTATAVNNQSTTTTTSSGGGLVRTITYQILELEKACSFIQVPILEIYVVGTNENLSLPMIPTVMWKSNDVILVAIKST